MFVALVTWLGRPVRRRAATSPSGELIAFYGYAVFLLFPLRTLTEAADKITRGHVAARRVIAAALARARAGRSGHAGAGARTRPGRTWSTPSRAW